MDDKSQFIHAETYPRQRSSLTGKRKKGKKLHTKRTAQDVSSEADRLPDAIPHITDPKPPTILFGSTASEVVARIDVEIERRKGQLREVAAKGGKVRRIRRDQHVLIAGVVGFPDEWETLRNDEALAASYESWKSDTIEFLQEHYADNGGELVSVIEHTDEKYPHMHFYVLPTLSPTFAARTVHDGWQQKLEAQAEKKTKTEIDAAYAAGASALGDAYYTAVSQKYGHLRHKGRRARLPRSFVLSEKKKAEKESLRLQKVRRHMDKVHARRLAAHNSRKQELDEKEKAVAAKEAETSRRQAALEARERALHSLENEAATARKTLLGRQRELDNEISSAKAYKKRYRDAIRDVGPRAEATLANVKQSIGALAKIRDRNSPAKNAVEARSLGVVKESIEALEMAALTFDLFVSARSDAPSSEPDPLLANSKHLMRQGISAFEGK